VTWHILTGEYPPQPGGVSDYTRHLARGLVEAGDCVEVWAPPCEIRDSHLDEAARGDSCVTGIPGIPGIVVHRLPGSFGLPSLLSLTRALNRFPAPRRILVQYVPHAFGWKGANLAFCLWLRLRRRDSIWVMFHEVMFRAEGDRRVSRLAFAAVTRLMATLVAGAADRAFVSIPGWRPMIEPLLRKGASVTWLSVPSAIPVLEDPMATAAIRTQYAAGHPLVGHFGTYGAAVGALLERTLEKLAAMSDCHVLLLGDRSDAACRALTSAHPSLAGRLFGTGRLTAEDVSRHVAACDLMLQPYPDGISSRRTSAMVALSHGRAIVTTAGWLTESLWAETGAAALVPVDPDQLAAAVAAMLFDVSRREAIGRRAAALYDERFHVRHAVSALRSLNAA
jgi:glycosyltransferase involved in cell wall biosynthesis